MPESNWSPTLRSVWKILADRVVGRDPTVLDQQHDSRCDELLTDGADLENCLRLGGDLMFQIGKPVCLRTDDGAVFDYGEGHGGNMALLHCVLDEVIYVVGADR